MSCELGAGISTERMASAEQSSNNRVIRVNRKFTRNPIMMRLHTRNNIKPLRMTAVEVLVQKKQEKGGGGES